PVGALMEELQAQLLEEVPARESSSEAKHGRLHRAQGDLTRLANSGHLPGILREAKRKHEIRGRHELSIRQSVPQYIELPKAHPAPDRQAPPPRRGLSRRAQPGRRVPIRRHAPALIPLLNHRSRLQQPLALGEDEDRARADADEATLDELLTA